ncbi:MAG: aminopeptidase, partial [Marinilabilia sp.]
MYKMTKVFFVAVLACFFTDLAAQNNDNNGEKEGYQFETLYDLPATSVKDQHRSGTCWSFAGVSFLESEMIRLGKDPID